MIKLEKTAVMNMENAVRGMRNPMDSWDKSDSYTTHIEDTETLQTADFDFFVGDNDYELMVRLAKGGSDDRKFMRQIFVSVDITAPLYWWKEYDTYKVGTVANSCSTMHKIHAKEFTLDDFSHDKLNWRGLAVLNFVIGQLNQFRDLYNETHDREWWDQIIQTLPTSYNQLRTCTMNYENLVNMYHARKNHKLKEWRDFCDWIRGLPYAELITGE